VAVVLSEVLIERVQKTVSQVFTLNPKQIFISFALPETYKVLKPYRFSAR